jgi:hypothetical protein
VKLTAFVAAVLLGTVAMAQTAAPAAEAPKPTWTFALKGFVSMSAAYQTGQFILSEGQQSLGSATAASPVHDKDSLTFDVRQSRFNFSVKGPQVLFGATPSGVLEIDFMQGFGAGNFGDVSLLNRLRTAYSELDWGSTKLQLGQQNDLIFAMAPTSLSHIAFPLGYFTGNVGWRRPGVFGYHTFAAKDLKVEGAWEVGRSQWADSAACVVTVPAGATACSGVGGAAAGDPGGINLGEASSAPAVEGRVTVSYAKLLTGFVGAHWNLVDLTGYGAQTGVQANGTTHTLKVVVYNAGAKFTVPLPNDMGLTVAATGFTGNNVYPLVANFTTGGAPLTTAGGTFRVGLNAEDLPTWGYWAQAGLNFTKELSLWGFYGEQRMDQKKLVRSFNTTAPGATAYENATTNVIAMYRDGGYGLSAEWINFATKYGTGFDVAAGTTPGTKFATNRTSRADQYMVTANYFF